MKPSEPMSVFGSFNPAAVFGVFGGGVNPRKPKASDQTEAEQPATERILSTGSFSGAALVKSFGGTFAKTKRPARPANETKEAQDGR